MTEIGFIGLGKMGGPMAANLVRLGSKVNLYDRRPEAAEALVKDGAIWHSDLDSLAARSDIVFLSLPGPVEVEATVRGEGGLAVKMRAGSTLIDLTTNSVGTVRQLHAELARCDIAMLDCPVSGGVKGAASGKLALWVGGDRSAYDANLPTLQMIGDKVSYIGDIGSATIAKLVHNCAANILNCALAEVFSMGVKAGVDPVTLYRTISEGALGRRKTFDGLVDQFLAGKYDPPGFELNLARKDVTLAVNLARDFDVPMPLANSVLQDLIEASGRGWGSRDFRVAMLMQLQRAQVSFEVDEATIASLTNP
jgi:3-hydroxyisobutyrate dehydrogenase